MLLSFKQTLWQQFGAAILMLENAISACPTALWDEESKFWYSSYHTLFYLDYYLSLSPADFRPPAPFTLSEFDSLGSLPERVYTKEELLIYLQFCRNKCYTLLMSLTDELAEQRFINIARNYSMMEMIFYNMRHVQHHVGQLHLILRQKNNDAPKWVSQANLSL